MEADVEENQPSICVWNSKSQEAACHFCVISFEIGINYSHNVRRNVLLHNSYINQRAEYKLKYSQSYISWSCFSVKWVAQLISQCRQALEYHHLLKTQISRILQQLFNNSLCQSKAIWNVFSLQLSFLFQKFLCLSNLVSYILIYMMIRDQLKPDDAHIQNVTTVEEHMSLHKDHIKGWSYDQNKVVEVNIGDNPGALACQDLKSI